MQGEVWTGGIDKRMTFSIRMSFTRCGFVVEVFGHDPAKEAREIKRRIGVVPQENALDEGLTVLENMRIYARFGGIGKAEADGRITALLKHMSLESKRDATIKALHRDMAPLMACGRPQLDGLSQGFPREHLADAGRSRVGPRFAGAGAFGIRRADQRHELRGLIRSARRKPRG